MFRCHDLGASPKSSKSLDHCSTENHGDLGYPHFRKPPLCTKWHPIAKMPGVRVSYHPRIKWRIVSGLWRGNVGVVAVGVAFQPFWEIPAVNGELDNF